MSAKNLVVLSGKGGTGKTSLSAAFAHLFSISQGTSFPVMVDADVDAANLSLVLNPSPSEAQEFWGGGLAVIDPSICDGCDACFQVCRYDAVIRGEGSGNSYAVDPIACDGCAACVYTCPEKAIKMVPQQEGEWFHSTTPYGTLFHAELFPGRENSGKLVTLIKQHARLYADDTRSKVIIIDGPPGIGCPVISACAGADLGLMVTEPGVSALHDLKRIYSTLHHFHIPTAICINKADLYPQGVTDIYQFAHQEDIHVLGEIPFDEHIPISMVREMPVTCAFENSSAAISIRSIFEKITEILIGNTAED